MRLRSSSLWLVLVLSVGHAGWSPAQAARKGASSAQKVADRARHRLESRTPLPLQARKMLASAGVTAHDPHSPLVGMVRTWFVDGPRRDAREVRRVQGILRQRLHVAQLPAAVKRDAGAFFAQVDRLGLRPVRGWTETRHGTRVTSVDFEGQDRHDPDLHHSYAIRVHGKPGGASPILVLVRNEWRASRQSPSSGIMMTTVAETSYHGEGDTVARYVSDGRTSVASRLLRD